MILPIGGWGGSWMTGDFLFHLGPLFPPGWDDSASFGFSSEGVERRLVHRGRFSSRIDARRSLGG